MAKSRSNRERTERDLRRPRAFKRPFDRLLIVTEGELTEPRYFEAMRQEQRTSSTHVRVVPGNRRTEPLQVVEFARKQFLSGGGAYEWVFAVFDSDMHQTFEEALRRAKALDRKLKTDEGAKARFVAVPSIPFFEVWLLLHFEDCHAFGAPEDITTRLRRHLPGYKKSDDAYAATQPHLAEATRRAQALRTRLGVLAGNEPWTEVDQVVERIAAARR